MVVLGTNPLPHHLHIVSAWPCLQVLVVKTSLIFFLLKLRVQNCEKVPVKDF